MAQLTTHTQDGHKRNCVKLEGKGERTKADDWIRRNGFTDLVRTGNIILLENGQTALGNELCERLNQGARRRPKRAKASLRVRKSGRP